MPPAPVQLGTAAEGEYRSVRRAFACYRENQVAKVRAALDQPTAYVAIEAFLRSSVDGLTVGSQPG